MNRNGALIVLCGIDGSGKTVQSELLCQRLQRAGYRIRNVAFPRYEDGFFGELIARYLRGELSVEGDTLDPYVASLPFACDRWEARPDLRRWLEAGDVIVCNRYVSANLAHQGSKFASREELEKFRRWVDTMEYDVFELPRPDLHVWLEVPPQCAVDLIARKGDRSYLQGKTDIHEADIEHLRATARIYRLLAEEDAGWTRIPCTDEDGMRSIEQISSAVWENVREILPSDELSDREKPHAGH